MIEARARANHQLYLARIVLAAWRTALEQRDIPAATLTEAFQGGAREHLVAAYGWFLLAVSQAGGSLPSVPPRCCSELPPVPEGKVLPGEINELRRLEAGGWIADMLAAGGGERPGVRQQGNLAVAAPKLPGVEQVEHWLQQLSSLIERMADSLDEY